MKTKPQTKTKTKTSRKPINLHAKAAETANLILAKARMLGSLTDDLSRFLTLCVELKISEITWEFSGYGDSGDVDDINFWVRTSKDGTTMVSRYGKNNKAWTPLHEELHGICRDQLFDLFISGATDVNWCDNDGGYGTATLNLETGDLEVEAHAYEKVVSYSNSRNRSLLDCINEETERN